MISACRHPSVSSAKYVLRGACCCGRFGMFRQARLAVTVLTDLLLTTKTLQQLMNENAEASPNDDRNADPQGNLRSHGHCATGHEASENCASRRFLAFFPLVPNSCSVGRVAMAVLPNAGLPRVVQSLPGAGNRTLLPGPGGGVNPGMDRLLFRAAIPCNECSFDIDEKDDLASA